MTRRIVNFRVAECAGPFVLKTTHLHSVQWGPSLFLFFFWQDLLLAISAVWHVTDPNMSETIYLKFHQFKLATT